MYEYLLFVQIENGRINRVSEHKAKSFYEAMPVNSDTSQFAGLLLGSGVDGQGSRVIMFCATSAGAPVWPLLQQTALALRKLRSCGVALVCLCGRRHASGHLGSNLLADIGGSDWAVTGENDHAEAHWRHGREEGLTAVPADAFVDLLNLIRHRFEFILVEGGAVPSSPQSLMVASSCTGVILVVQPGITTTREVEHSHTMLVQARAHLQGFVFVVPGTNDSGSRAELGLVGLPDTFRLNKWISAKSDPTKDGLTKEEST